MSDAPPMKSLAELIAVMAALRTPETGCPWDLEQSFATIAPYTIEEAYEVADAIARGDRRDLKEELGDLLLQVVYHARLAQEEKSFEFSDVVHGITTKMIRRHPHVFGDETARTAGMAAGAWERIKAEERATKSASGTISPGPEVRGVDGSSMQPPASLLDGVPVGMPGLTRAVKLQEKAARVGFDWPSLQPVFEKMREELAELEEVAFVQGLDGGNSSTSHAPALGQSPGAISPGIEEEFGDLLFVMANVARHLKIDPETALRGANAKFQRRFRYIETALASAGTCPERSNLAEMDALWDEAKAVEK